MKTLLRVKTIIFTAILCILFSTNASARDNNKDLEGVWKAVPPVGMEKQTEQLVFYKVFNKDKTFINFTSTDKGTTFIITSRGNYSVEMPGIYLEYLSQKFASKFKVSSNVITYKRDKKILTIIFKVHGKTFTETWMKVCK